MFIIFSVFYILIAAAMIVLILIQRGSGANAGSGFGGGASATVFGARGSTSFLSRATAVLAALFFLLSLGMGIYLNHAGAPVPAPGSDLGVMAGLATPAANGKSGTAPAATTVVPKPAAPPTAGNDVPVAPAAPAAAATAGGKQDQ